MNSFASWFLHPQIKIELKPLDVFNEFDKQEKSLSIFMTTEAEIEKSSEKYAYAVKQYNEFKCGVLYFYDETRKNLFYVTPLNYPKKISCQKPGKAHNASHLGALFYNSIHQLEKEVFHFIKNKNIFVTLSYETRKIIENEDFEFFLGVLQRSVSCKIKKIDFSNSHIKNLFFCESIFTQSSLNKAILISDAMCTTRTLINMPANILNPDSYEDILHSLIQDNFDHLVLPRNVTIETYDYEKLIQENCNLICAVGQGSHHKPRILKLVYLPLVETVSLKHISLVGKGITFDSGGYDIKSSSGMRNMKKDMGGSAAALGIFLACAKLNLPVKLSCYLAIAENMVAGNAMKPGDVFKTRNGFHVEIENTDAEGRLVLADAMCLACDEKPDWLINLATLTGAARVSLGPMVDSVFGNNKITNELLYSTGIENGDWVWNMPLVSEYETYLDSSVADFLNSSPSSYAGSVTAALFLQKFITIDAWSHIDTFMWADKANYLWQEGGAPTAKCVRLVTRAIEKFILKEENES